MSKSRKVILVVEDDKRWFERMKDNLLFFLDEFDKEAEIVHASTQEEAWGFFEEYNPVIIIMDACVPGDEMNTGDLVKKIIAKGYTDPIVTASSVSTYNKRLLKCGATHNGKDKGGACQLAIKVL